MSHSSHRSTRAWEAWWVGVLCLMAALRLFLGAATLPLFTNVDETSHYDLVFKFANGNWPTRKNDRFDAATGTVIVLHASPEYLMRRDQFTRSRPRPLWQAPPDMREARLNQLLLTHVTLRNAEAFSPPVYYLLAGLWYEVGRGFGLTGANGAYWVRFLNVLPYVGLMLVAYAFVRRFYPDQTLLRLGVVTLLAFFPQDVFYSINSDVVSPLFFLAALYALLAWNDATRPALALGICGGLFAALTFLVKLSNVAVLAIFGAVFVEKSLRLARNGQWRAHVAELILTGAAAVVPIGAWLLRNKLSLGDATGTADKIALLGWTRKSFGEIWSHPLFTLDGLIYYFGQLIPTFWRGETIWFREQPTPAAIDRIFLYGSPILLMAAVASWWIGASRASSSERRADAYLLAAVGISMLFLMCLSTMFDFGACPYPSRQHPYFVSGRLIIGVLAPFLILIARGAEFLCSRWAPTIGPAIVVAGIAIISIAARISLFVAASQSEYNWFHLR